MPKVTFVNEHREVEVAQGSLISEAAAKLGIDVCREHFVGTDFGNKSVWVDGEDGCLSEPTLFERWWGRCKGQRRLANRARVLKDCKVWTQQGMSGRTGQERDIDPAPRPSEDEAIRFDHEHSTAGTAWNVYGHPKTIGSGTREPPKYEPPKKKAAVKKKAAPAKDKAAAKKDDGKPKKDEAKAEAKKDDAKADQAAAKKADAKPKKDEAKAEAKKDEAKAEAKKDEAKAEPKKDEAKAEAKKDDAKAEAKKDDAKGGQAAAEKDEAKADKAEDEKAAAKADEAEDKTAEAKKDDAGD